jgi:hypothetical protein
MALRRTTRKKLNPIVTAAQAAALSALERGRPLAADLSSRVGPAVGGAYGTVAAKVAPVLVDAGAKVGPVLVDARGRVTPVVAVAVDRVGPYVAGAVDRVGPLVADARDRVGPLVADARDRVGPAVSDVVERVGPAIVDARHKAGPALVSAAAAAQGARSDLVSRAEPVAREAARRGSAAVAALRGAEAVPVRTRRWPRVLVVTGLLGTAAYGAWRLIRQPPTDPWTTVEPVTQPAAPSPGPDSGTAPDGGTTPDTEAPTIRATEPEADTVIVDVVTVEVDPLDGGAGTPGDADPATGTVPNGPAGKPGGPTPIRPVTPGS